jgi:hypothetical protein
VSWLVSSYSSSRVWRPVPELSTSPNDALTPTCRPPASRETWPAATAGAEVKRGETPRTPSHRERGNRQRPVPELSTFDSRLFPGQHADGGGSAAGAALEAERAAVGGEDFGAERETEAAARLLGAIEG